MLLYPREDTHQPIGWSSQMAKMVHRQQKRNSTPGCAEQLRKDIEVKALRDLVVLLKQEMLAGLEDLIHVLLQTTTNCTTFF